MENSAPYYIMVYHVSNLTFLLVCIMYMSNCSGRDWPRRNAQPWNPGYIRRRSSSTSSSTVTSPTPSSTSSSTVTSPTPAPVSSSSLSSTATYSFTPSTEQSQVALPVLMIAGCIVGTCLCGIALAVNHMWRTKTKTRPRRNEQPVENQQRVSAHKTLD